MTRRDYTRPPGRGTALPRIFTGLNGQDEQDLQDKANSGRIILLILFSIL